MGSRPSVSLRLHIARSRQTVTDQLVLGLVTGGLIGPGLVIDRREVNAIHFSRAVGANLPDRGELVVEEDAQGETSVECRLWCRGIDRRQLMLSAGLGALVAVVVALAFDWLLPLSALVGGVVAIGWDLAARRRRVRHLRRRVEAFVANMAYLKTV